MNKEMKVAAEIVAVGWKGLSLLTRQLGSGAETLLKFWVDAMPEDVGGFRSRLRSAIHLRELRKLQRNLNPNY